MVKSSHGSSRGSHTEYALTPQKFPCKLSSVLVGLLSCPLADHQVKQQVRSFLPDCGYQHSKSIRSPVGAPDGIALATPPGPTSRSGLGGACLAGDTGAEAHEKPSLQFDAPR